jgi:hypothetical protein
MAESSPTSALPEIVALHRLVVGQNTTVDRIGATEPSAIDARARERLLDYHTNVLDRQEFDGSAVRAWWRNQGPGQALDDLLTCPATEFGDRTFHAMQQLAQEAKGNAKSGLVVFTRVRDGARASLACFKLELESLEEVGFRWQAGQPAEKALVPIDVADLLPHAKQLQKAAIYPGPGTIEVWVVDDQLATPADYWMRFLGARANPGEKRRLAEVIALTEHTLTKDFGIADPAPVIAQAVAMARERDQAVRPADFAREAAEAAGLASQMFIERASDREPATMDPQFSVTPLAARQTRTTYDLGGGVKLTGPRGVVEARVEVVPENGARYLKVRIADGPHISHS